VTLAFQQRRHFLGLFLAVGDSYKFGFLNPDDQEYFYPNTWAWEKTSDQHRLAVAPRSNYVATLLRHVERMSGPFFVLYVLVVARGGAETGRYQSVELQSRETLQGFLHEFKAFFEQDGRHHLWIRSASDAAMLVYDRHNIIYAYGPLEEFRGILFEIGLEESKSIGTPDPHIHHYNESLDSEERRLLGYWEWDRTPLRDQDD
jgi:hypothetical protein